MADWNQHDRAIRRRELEALRREVEALHSKARGHKEDAGSRRAYTRVLQVIDQRLENDQ